MMKLLTSHHEATSSAIYHMDQFGVHLDRPSILSSAPIKSINFAIEFELDMHTVKHDKRHNCVHVSALFSILYILS